MKVVETLYNGGQCQRGVRVDDANELFDLGMGQYAMEHVPENIYYISAPCGTTCKDGGRTWKNCEGFISDAPDTSLSRFIIPAIVIAALIILFILLKKKK